MAFFILFAAVICGVLAAFTWRRSIVAVIISFVLWALCAASGFGGGHGAHPGHPIVATLAILGFGALLAAAIATRQQASLPAAMAGSSRGA